MSKNRVAVSIAFVFVYFLLAACAAVEYKKPVIEGPERIIDTNYEIDTSQKVHAGGKMVEAKDYWATFRTQKKMKALNNFTIEGPGVKHSGAKGDLYNIILTTNVNEQISYFIEIPGVFRRYGITTEGQWQDTQFFAGQTQNANTSITPKDATFEIIEIANIHEVDPSKPFTHFEIIFIGKTPETIHLLYREYDLDRPDQPAFQKKLAYPVDTEIIRHGKVAIKIHEVTAESISYTVLEDGVGG